MIMYCLWGVMRDPAVNALYSRQESLPTGAADSTASFPSVAKRSCSSPERTSSFSSDRSVGVRTCVAGRRVFPLLACFLFCRRAAGVEWEERQYVAKLREDGKADTSDWTDEKFKLVRSAPASLRLRGASAAATAERLT